MKIKDLKIPEAALAAGRNVMSGIFRKEDVSAAVGTVLYNLHYHTLQKMFDYGIHDHHTVNMTVTNRLIEKARKDRKITGLGAGKWQALVEPQETDECLEGIHSWVHEKGKLPRYTPCTNCGEIYGDPD